MSKYESAPTVRFDIFMAGDVDRAKQICREFCMVVGFCVHVESVTFIYTGAEESGFKVGVINYPRFPCDEKTLRKHACSLASLLRAGCCQNSYSIVGPVLTEWFSCRDSE